MNKVMWLGMALSLGLTACSLGKKTSEQNTALIRQNKEVNDLYGPLVGTYNGKMLNTNHGDEDVQLIIYLSTESVTNPDGSPGSKDVPQAYLRRDYPVIADYSLDVSGYSREVGDVSFRNLGDEPLVRSIRLHVSGKHLSGPVINREGTLGNLELDFTSKDTSSRNDIEDRLRRRYQAVQGTYTGTIPGGNGRKTRHLSITLTADISGSVISLSGYYKNLDVPGGEVDLPLTVTYRTDTAPPQITMHGRGGLKYALDMVGTLLDETMIVDITSPFFEGYLGRATLKRPGGSPLPPSSELGGTYAGNFLPKGTESAVPILLELSVSGNSKTPTISCVYNEVADASAKINFKGKLDAASGAITLSGKTAGGSRRDLRGTLKAGVLKFKLLKKGVTLGSGELNRQP